MMPTSRDRGYLRDVIPQMPSLLLSGKYDNVDMNMAAQLHAFIHAVFITIIIVALIKKTFLQAEKYV